jgi:hypothetical protein
MVPARDFPASFDAFVAGFEAQEVEDKTSDGDEIMCGVIFSHSASVFVKGDVEDPVAAVFNSPMLPRAAELMRGVAVVADFHQSRQLYVPMHHQRFRQSDRDQQRNGDGESDRIERGGNPSVGDGSFFSNPAIHGFAERSI